MAISMDLRVLARKLEKSSDDILINSSKKSPEVFQKVATAIAAASTLLEGVADDMDSNASFEITPQQLDEIAALASAFDESGDPLLQKQASVLDELLLSIAAPKNAALNARKVTEDEINRLRAERRKAKMEEYYDGPRQVISKMENAKEVAKAVEQQVKRYVPMEAPLQTRYPPDRPGGQMTRITDHVYQDIVTGIIYDFKAGYKTLKGNEVPGGSVEAQIHELGDPRDRGASLFETRESLMSRYASDDQVIINKVASALKAIRDHAPELLDRAIDNAMVSGLSTSQVADILASDISEEGLKALADDESAKKKRELLKSNIDRNLSKEESEEEYYNAKHVLQPLAELVEADPSHARQWVRMMDDTLIALRGVGMHENHLALLSAEFMKNKPGFGSETVPPSAPLPSSIPSMERPRNRDDFETAETHRIAQQSLMALVINAIQEIAPHLLKSAISKAKAEGLEDQQIKSILASGFNNQFDKPADEFKVAESIFPHLQDLGWTDLIEKHIKVMASLGVDKDDLRKIADQYGSPDLKSLNKLAQTLKFAGVKEFTAEELGDEPEKPVQILTPFEEEKPAKPKITAEQLPDLVQHVIERLRVGLADPKEYHRLKLSFQGKELIDVAVNYEVQKFRKEMNTEMFSEFANLAREWAVAELLPTMTQQTTPIVPVSKAKPPPPAVAPATKAKAKYDENSEEYQAAFDEATEFFTSGEPKKIITDIYQFEKNKNPRIDDNKTKASKLFKAVVERITDRNVAGEETPTNEEILDEILAEMRKITYGPWHPKAKEKELVQIKGESPEEFEERKRKSTMTPMTEKHLELGGNLPEETGALSTDKPAQNSTKFKYLKWGDYQKHWDVEINEVQAKELENKIEDKIKADREKLEEAFRNFVYDIDSTPQSINDLPDDVRREVGDMLGRGESSAAVLAYLSKKNIERVSKKEEPFTVPKLNELKAERFRLVGPQKTNELKAYRNDMLGKIIRRNVNSVLSEAGFDQPMFEPEDDDNKTYHQVNNDLRVIMGEERAKVPFFKKQPIGPSGKPLIQFWQDPAGYWEAYVAAKNHFEGYGDAERKAQDDEMVSKGYNSPDEPVFGYQTTRQLLRNLDMNVSGNILANFKIPGTNEQYKTLFSNPEEYQQAFFEAKKQFSTEWRDKPREWEEIVGANTTDISDIPLGIRNKILPLAVKGYPKKKIEEIGASMGIDTDTIKRIREYVAQSGDKIRSTIMALAFSGTPFVDAKPQLEEKFPGAKIPWDIVEFVYNNLQSDKDDTEASQQEQNKWMTEMGFYPPYQIAVGGIGKDRERNGKSFRREEPVTFASILKPRKPKGTRDSGASGESKSHAELQAELRASPQKSRISRPKWVPNPAQRQPGESKAFNPIKGLSPFVSKK